jgi:autotransporter-associated beta strand protein
MGGTVAAFNSTITGGNLTSGNGTDLILINNDTAPGAAGNLIINSAITDNSTPIGITAGKTTTLAVGQIQLGGTNTFTGASYIDGGATVVLESAGAWNGSGTSFSALNFAPNEGTTTGGTFDLNGFNATVGGLATTEAGLNATVQNLSASTASTLTINLSGGSNTYAGTIADGGGAALNLATSGSGTLILAGANTYSGGTTIGGGTLLANGSASTGTGEVTVANGGFLGGSGTINTSGVTSGNALTIASGGTLSQTAVSAGLGASSLTLILQAGTTVNLNSGAELAFDLGASGVRAFSEILWPSPREL